jgi:3-hydroxyisobutyrate dehydrogenase-like beta-hydroxyacid dehydrogenase
MGRALAGAFLAANHPTTVWNRTPGRSAALESAGARVASSPADAVAASSLTVACVLDPPSVGAVLDALDDDLSGATIVNLTTSVPDDARVLAARVASSGGRYLDGKIMVTTSMIGTDDGFIIYSGDSTVFDDHADTLRALGGDADFLGADAGLASLYDLAMLDIFFNGMTAFLHAAALVGVDGVTARTFLPYADRVVDVLRATMVELADAVDLSLHPGDEDNLEMETKALDHIVELSATSQIDTTLPAAVRELGRTAVAAGHGGDGFSRVIDILRRRTGVEETG